MASPQPVVIYPPDDGCRRRMRIVDAILGLAFSLQACRRLVYGGSRSGDAGL
jgi:hypothetical protein